MIDAANAFQIGLALGVASILSIGPNNLMLVREGLIRGRVGLVSGVILASQGALLVVSFAAASALGNLDPLLRASLSWGGLAVICWFAYRSFCSAADPKQVEQQADGRESTRSCIARVLPVVWLNPLSYLEFLFIPAAIMQSFSDDGARLPFTAALLLMAAICCYLYALGGRAVVGVLRRGANVRMLDRVSGVILSVTAVVMATGLVVGIE